MEAHMQVDQTCDGLQSQRAWFNTWSLYLQCSEPAFFFQNAEFNIQIELHCKLLDMP